MLVSDLQVCSLRESGSACLIATSTLVWWANVGTVKTVWGAGRGPGREVVAGGSRETEQLGSEHDEAKLKSLKAAARQQVAAGQL